MSHFFYFERTTLKLVFCMSLSRRGENRTDLKNGPNSDSYSAFVLKVSKKSELGYLFYLTFVRVVKTKLISEQ